MKTPSLRDRIWQTDNRARLAAAVEAVGAAPGKCHKCHERVWFRARDALLYGGRIVLCGWCGVGRVHDPEQSAILGESECVCPRSSCRRVNRWVLSDTDPLFRDRGQDYRASCGCARRGAFEVRFDHGRGAYVRRRLVSVGPPPPEQAAREFGLGGLARIERPASGPRYVSRLGGTGRLPSAAVVARIRAAAVAALGRRGEAAAAWVGF